MHGSSQSGQGGGPGSHSRTVIGSRDRRSAAPGGLGGAAESLVCILLNSHPGGQRAELSGTDVRGRVCAAEAGLGRIIFGRAATSGPIACEDSFWLCLVLFWILPRTCILPTFAHFAHLPTFGLCVQSDHSKSKNNGPQLRCVQCFHSALLTGRTPPPQCNWPDSGQLGSWVCSCRQLQNASFRPSVAC